jgi:hypothetical protein
MMGLASASAAARTCSRAPRAPTPTSMATLEPWLRTSAARSRLPGSGTERAPRKVGAVAGVRAGPTDGQGSASAATTCRSLGKVRWLTVRRARQVRMARSTREGIEAGAVISMLYWPGP